MATDGIENHGFQLPDIAGIGVSGQQGKDIDGNGRFRLVQLAAALSKSDRTT
jgi:hypothetical protein